MPAKSKKNSKPASKKTKDTKKKTTKPSNKETKKVVKPVDKSVGDKARALLLKHPELTNNAKDLFRNENGKTIVEEAVVRGDKEPCEIMNQYDLTSKDINELAKEATKNIDETLMKYDETVAREDAVQKVIWSKDEGKYAGKVNSSTFALIMEAMGKPTQSKEASEKEDKGESITYDVAPGKEIEVSEKQEKHLKKMEEGRVTGLGEGLRRPDADKILKVKEEEKQKEAPKKAPKEEPKKDVSEDKDKQEDKEMDKKAMQEELMALSSKVAELTEALATEEEETSEEKLASAEDIVAALEVVAGDLEAEKDPELFKIAFQIDSICDVLEGKEGATLQSDPDEAYMKKFFKGDVQESDSDESYMKKDMQGDDTVEVKKVVKKKASEQPPYQIK